MNATDFALIRRYHAAHMETPFRTQSLEALGRIEDQMAKAEPPPEVRELIQAALGNGADQWAWQPGERWQDAAVRVIRQAREWREEVA